MMMADDDDRGDARIKKPMMSNGGDRSAEAAAAAYPPEVCTSTTLPAARRCCRCCYPTVKIQVLLLATLAVAFFILVSLLVLLLLRHSCRECPGLDGHPDPGSQAAAAAAAVGSAPAIDSSRKPETPNPESTPGSTSPWSGIRLPRFVVPYLYNAVLTIDLDRFKFSGSVDISITVLNDTDFIVLHVSSLQIQTPDVFVEHSISGEQEPIARIISGLANDLYIVQTVNRLDRGNSYRVIFRQFAGVLEDDLRGLYRSIYRSHDDTYKYLAVSQLQSIDARRVFPCFDEPDMKAKFSVTIRHQKAYTALSNMPLIRSKDLPNDWVEDEFAETPIMSTYLLAFVVADFKHRELTTANGLNIRVWARPDMYEQTAYALNFSEKAYQFFSEYFGTPEMVSKADHAAIPDFSAGAMENWGLVLYRETALLHDEATSSLSNKYWVSLVMAHEIAHTWFGNMVTMRWWDDLWLNEGFANTLMYFALDAIYEPWKVFDLQLVNNIYPVMTKDSLVTSHAISTQIVHPDDITAFFDSISYDKGMAVLRTLRGFLGWENFRRGLQNYIRKFKLSNAEMSQLWQTFEESSNYSFSIGDIMDTWTRQMGFPVVTIRHLSGDKYQINQKRFLVNANDNFDPRTSPYGYKWKIPFSYKIQGDTTVRTKWMDMGSADISIPVGSWMIGNIDYMGFYRTNYDELMWKRLIRQLLVDHKVFSAANRAGLISDAFNLARANQLSYEIAFNLTAYLHKEEEYVPWRAYLDSIDFIKGMLATSDSYGMLQKYISDLVAPQYKRVGTSDQGDLLIRNLRKAILEAATSVSVSYAIDWAKRMFDDWKKYETKIPPDYAIVIYAVGIQEGGEEEWDYLWTKAQKTQVASEAEIMMNALAYTQQPWLLWRYARYSLNSSLIRMQDVRNLFRYFSSTPLGRSVALQFLLTNWDEINTRFGADPFLLRDIIYAITSFINTDYEYQQLDRLYLDKPPSGVASKSAENSLALVRSNINWVLHNHDTISEWLERKTRNRSSG